MTPTQDPPETTREVELVAPDDSQLVYFAALAAVVAWILSRLAVFANRVIFFDGMVADGPFQLFNSLRRLSVGQVAGRDFPVFHGLGVPLLHYPLFRLFGEGLYGSEMSRQLTSLILCTAAMALMFRAATGSWRRAILPMAMMLILEETLALLGLGRFADPANTMNDLRGMLPLLGAVLYATAQPQWLRVTLMAVCLGAVPVLGVDQAPPFFLAVVVVWVVLLVRHLFKRESGLLQNVHELMIGTIWGLGMAGCLMLLISGGAGTVAALKFNFLETPRDQFWYFGVPPNPYFKSVADLLTRAYSLPILACLVAAVWSLLRLVRRATLSARTTGCTILLCYGLFSMVPALWYLGPYLRNGIAAMVLASFLIFWAAATVWLRRLRKPLLAGLLAFALIESGSVVRNAIRMAQAPDLYSVHFSAKWEEILRTGESLVLRYRSRGKQALWSSYSNELNSRIGEFPLAEDYIIHALGPERRSRYLTTFQTASPAVVSTADFAYEPWLQNETWGFYEELLRHYFVAGRAGRGPKPEPGTEGEVYWVRREPGAGLVSTTQGKARLIDESHFVIESPDGGAARLGTVSLRYGIRYSSNLVRFLSKMSRYLLYGDSPRRVIPVSLPPYADKWTFPVVTANAPIKFAASTTGILSGGQVTITDVSVEWWPEAAPVSLFDATVEVESEDFRKLIPGEGSLP